MRARMAVPLTALWAACATQGGTERQASAPPPTASRPADAGMGAGGMAQMCPMAVPGTRVAAVDTADGVALAFTTSGDAEELRRRVRAMAEMHNQHHAGEAAAADQGSMHGGMMHGGGMMGGGMGGSGAGSGGTMGGTGGGHGRSHEGMMPPPARAAVEDVDGGARIVLTPFSAGEVSSLRAHVHEHATEMQRSGACPMMQMGGSREGDAQQHAH